jgi:amino acid permease
MYAAILIMMIAGFTYLNAIDAGVASIAWVLICGVTCFSYSKYAAERWERTNGRS